MCLRNYHKEIQKKVEESELQDAITLLGQFIDTKEVDDNILNAKIIQGSNLNWTIDQIRKGVVDISQQRVALNTIANVILDLNNDVNEAKCKTKIGICGKNIFIPIVALLTILGMILYFFLPPSKPSLGGTWEGAIQETGMKFPVEIEEFKNKDTGNNFSISFETGSHKHIGIGKINTDETIKEFSMNRIQKDNNCTVPFKLLGKFDRKSNIAILKLSFNSGCELPFPFIQTLILTRIL